MNKKEKPPHTRAALIQRNAKYINSERSKSSSPEKENRKVDECVQLVGSSAMTSLPPQCQRQQKR